MSKKALICGISGQDGAYLSRFLLSKGYEVFGTSRDAQVSSFNNLEVLEIRDRIQLRSMSINDFRSVIQTLDEIKPDEVYNLAGQSSVGLSFEQPMETLESITVGTLNLLESIRFIKLPIKLYNASSSECFGDTNGAPADETTPFHPRSPYAMAKAAAFWGIANYREAYRIFACSGLLFNHESPLRPERFVTQKIVTAACKIAAGLQKKLCLGAIDIERDWGWAPEYIEAMWLILQQDEPDDFVIATGKTNSLRDFISIAFSTVGLDWEKYVEIDPTLVRPTDIAIGRANPEKARKKLGWKAENEIQDVIRMMIQTKQKALAL